MDLYITSIVKINNRRICKNGDLLFQSESEDLNTFLREAYDTLNHSYPKFHKMDHLNKLGWLAAEFLLDGIDIKESDKFETGIVFLNNSSSLDTDEKFQESTGTIASPALFVYTLPNIVMGEICIRHGLKGENTFFITDGFDMELMHLYTQQLFENSEVEICISGWINQYREDHEVILYLIQKNPLNFCVSFDLEQIKYFYKK